MAILQKETIEKAEAFYKNKTGKEYKDLDENDFEKLIEIIFYNTEQFRSLIEKIIKSIDKSPNKSIIIENCKSHIISVCFFLPKSLEIPINSRVSV